MAAQPGGSAGAWNAYEELGLDRDAGLDEIKSAFREMARKHHPDKSKEGSVDDRGERFKRIRKAYDILSNKEAREQYDAGMAVKDFVEGTIVEVDLDDMHYSEEQQSFSFECRCSGSFCITEAQLDGGYDTVPCNTCSLCARVLYEVVEEEEEEGDAAQGEHR